MTKTTILELGKAIKALENLPGWGTLSADQKQAIRIAAAVQWLRENSADDGTGAV